MSAIRLARAGDRAREAPEVRGRLPRARRRAPGRRPAAGWPPRRSRPARASRRAATAATVIVPWNDPDAVRAALAEHEFAAVLAEPYPANMGLVPPAAGLPRAPARGRDRHRRAARLRRGHHGLPRRARRRPGPHRGDPRPDGHGQGHRRRAARRRLRRPPRAPRAARPGGRRLPGRHAQREPAGRRRRPGDAAPARRARPPAPERDDRGAGRGAARGRRGGRAPGAGGDRPRAC